MTPHFKRYQQELYEFADHGLLRKLRSYDRADARHIVIEGRTFLNFSSNDYLGLSTHPEVIQAAIEAIRLHGAGGRASRLVSGECPLYEELEKALAEYKGTESALVFSSGYHANYGLIANLAEKDGTIFLDRLCHASLIDAARFAGVRMAVFAHGDAESLRKALARRKGPALIITDGVFSMDGDIALLPDLLRVAEEREAQLLVDDAHGTGMIGPHGKGTAGHYHLESESLVQMGTLSKALGSLGGFFAGPALLREFLINRARTLIYTTALPPGVLAAATAAVRLARGMDGARQQLFQYSEQVRQEIRSLGWDTLRSATPIIPLILGTEERALKAAEILMERGIHAPAIRPPTVPKGSARIRLSLTALHEEADINCLIEALRRIREALP